VRAPKAAQRDTVTDREKPGVEVLHDVAGVPATGKFRELNALLSSFPRALAIGCWEAITLSAHSPRPPS